MFKWLKQLRCKHINATFIENYKEDAHNYCDSKGKPFTHKARSVWKCNDCNTYFGKAAHYVLEENKNL